MAVNADFSRQALFISQQLECSEQYAAELLHDVMSSNPNLAEERCLDMTVAEFHARRRQLVECLKYVFQATINSLSLEAPPLCHRLGLFVREQLLHRHAPMPSFAEKLLNEVDKVGETLGKVNIDRQNAGSATVAPSQGTSGKYLHCQCRKSQC